MTSNADKLEDRVAEILGQIQASVAEYVRTMNEAGALRRREADEAHRQQDKVVASLQSLEKQGREIIIRHGELASSVGKEWLALVERGLTEAATLQAHEAAKNIVVRIESRADELVERMERALSLATSVAAKNDRIFRAMAWKTGLVSVVWILAVVHGIDILIS